MDLKTSLLLSFEFLIDACNYFQAIFTSIRPILQAVSDLGCSFVYNSVYNSVYSHFGSSSLKSNFLASFRC